MKTACHRTWGIKSQHKRMPKWMTASINRSLPLEKRTYCSVLRKLRKPARSYVMFVRLSAGNNSAPTGCIFHEILHLSTFRKSLEKSDVYWTMHYCYNWRIKKSTRCHLILYCTVSGLTGPYLQLTTNQERHDQCGKQHHSRELLMMGTVMLETYWAYKKYNKI